MLFVVCCCGSLFVARCLLFVACCVVLSVFVSVGFVIYCLLYCYVSVFVVCCLLYCYVSVFVVCCLLFVV